jgi:hypothetical protein
MFLVKMSGPAMKPHSLVLYPEGSLGAKASCSWSQLLDESCVDLVEKREAENTVKKAARRLAVVIQSSAGDPVLISFTTMAGSELSTRSMPTVEACGAPC